MDQESKDEIQQENEAAQPDPEPEPQPTHKPVEVKCGKCGSEFLLPVEVNVTGFEFTCTNCGAKNSVSGV